MPSDYENFKLMLYKIFPKEAFQLEKYNRGGGVP
jgi:hypothetical protein